MKKTIYYNLFVIIILFDFSNFKIFINIINILNTFNL